MLFYLLPEHIHPSVAIQKGKTPSSYSNKPCQPQGLIYPKPQTSKSRMQGFSACSTAGSWEVACDFLRAMVDRGLQLRSTEASEGSVGLNARVGFEAFWPQVWALAFLSFMWRIHIRTAAV